MTAALLMLSAFLAAAQAPVSNLVITVGTTISDNQGNNWSYVLLGAPQPQLLAGKRFAIYGKPGYPTNAGSFTLRGTIFQQTDPNAANVLLNKSVALGENLFSLSNILDTLLHKVPGVTNETLPQKVITAFQTAPTSTNVASMLSLAAHVHPGLTMCAGQAFAEIITTTTTYEVREVNLANNVAAEVVGRVTIIPGSPIVLPAPGFTFQVASNTPSDHLRIRLRWGTSDAYRRLSLLGYGFNVWRIPLSNAVALGFTNTPPTLAQLYGTNFTQVNFAPVIAIKDFSTGHGFGGADDPNDKTTYFFSDNNHSFSGNQPFNDGQQFYYFVTARDVLGRDGLVSPGGLGEAFRRLPPATPTAVHVGNVFHAHGLTNQQALMVSWQQNLVSNDYVNQYWVYRWADNPTSFLTNDAAPSNGVIGVVSQLSGTNANSFIDNGLNAPLTPGTSNFWYTVRSVSLAAGGPLLSPHSVPMWGVLRERAGPAATTGQVLGSCGTPSVIFENFDYITNVTSSNTLAPPDTNHWNYRFTCQRRDPGTAWAQFFIFHQNGDPYVLGPVYFPPSGDTLSLDYSPGIVGTNDVATIVCEAGTFYGLVSTSAPVTITPQPLANARLETVFLAGQVMLTTLSSKDPLAAAIVSQRCLPGLGPTAYPDGTVRMSFDFNGPQTVMVQAFHGNAAGGGGWTDVGIAQGDQFGNYTVYYPECLLGPLPSFQGCLVNLPGNCVQHITRGSPTGPVNPINLTFVLTPRTHEYRLYRSVNDGPLTLIAQAAANYDSTDPFKTILVTDNTMPPSAARLCYYVQLLDEHGNGSPMTLLGCKEVKPATLPRPVLAQPQPVGDNSNPQVALTWYCPTNGVARFQVMIQRADHPKGGAPVGVSGVQLTPLLSYNPSVSYIGLDPDSPLDLFQFQVALLSPPAAIFGPGPQFTLTANVLTNVPYHISVAAMDDEGNAGEPSQVWNFTWMPTNALPNVPWPARPLPAANVFDDSLVPSLPLVYQPRVRAVVFYNANSNFDQTYPVGIRIGDIRQLSQRLPYNVGTTNFLSYLVIAPGGAVPEPPGPSVDPNTLIFHRVSSNPSHNGDPLLPIVVYRQQVANATYPVVSGTLTQVTPLIERLAYGVTNSGSLYYVTIYDRLIAGGTEGLNNQFGAFLYLRDQQPVMLGASYQYFVARFNGQREISEVIPAGIVTIPASP